MAQVCSIDPQVKKKKKRNHTAKAISGKTNLVESGRQISKTASFKKIGRNGVVKKMKKKKQKQFT